MTSTRVLRFVTIALAACWLNLASAAGMGAEDARHFLTRVGFGATPEMIVEYSKLSREQAIQKALAPVGAERKVAPPAEILRHVPQSEVKAMREKDKQTSGPRSVMEESVRRGLLMRGWWIDEMLAADTPAEQLRERMVLFWHNHFVSSYVPVRSTKWMLEQNQIFRQNALGQFDDMLHAVSKSPAMVIYLDSASNRKDSPNENFAREVMELFTLGEGNYTEKDIKEAARAFTGWSVDRESGEFVVRAPNHDEGEKVILGKRGNFDGDAALDVILAQPKVAEFITGKLWVEFISPTPDAKEVQRIASTFRSSGYELSTAVAGLLRSPAFWDPKNRGVIVKSPVDLVVGTLHTFEVKEADGLPLAEATAQLGQKLFMPPNVRGWPGGDTWINSQTLLARKQFIERVFRSEDTGDRMNDAGEMKKKGRKGKKGAGEMDNDIRQEARSKLEGMHIDATDWMKRVSSLGLKPEQVLLAVPAEKPVKTQADLRELLLDATYQVR